MGCEPTPDLASVGRLALRSQSREGPSSERPPRVSWINVDRLFCVWMCVAGRNQPDRGTMFIAPNVSRWLTFFGSRPELNTRGPCMTDSLIARPAGQFPATY